MVLISSGFCLPSGLGGDAGHTGRESPPAGERTDEREDALAVGFDLLRGAEGGNGLRRGLLILLFGLGLGLVVLRRRVGIFRLGNVGLDRRIEAGHVDERPGDGGAVEEGLPGEGHARAQAEGAAQGRDLKADVGGLVPAFGGPVGRDLHLGDVLDELVLFGDPARLGLHDELVDAGVGQGNVCGPCASTVGDDFVEDGEVFAPVHVVSAVAQCREDLRAFNRDARARCRINGADDEVEGCFFRVVNDGAVGKDQSETGMAGAAKSMASPRVIRIRPNMKGLRSRNSQLFLGSDSCGELQLYWKSCFSRGVLATTATSTAAAPACGSSRARAARRKVVPVV